MSAGVHVAMRPADSVRGAAGARGGRCGGYGGGGGAALAGVRAGRGAAGHAERLHTGVRVRAPQLRYVPPSILHPPPSPQHLLRTHMSLHGTQSPDSAFCLPTVQT